MRAAIYLAVLFLAAPAVANAGIFGEGYSSAEPGAPSSIYFRVFTVITGPQACGKSPRVVELRILPNPLQMKSG